MKNYCPKCGVFTDDFVTCSKCADEKLICVDCLSECLELHEIKLRWPDGEEFDYTP